MQNREYSRIFVKKGKNLFKVANIRATRDESVILTLYGGASAILMILILSPLFVLFLPEGLVGLPTRLGLSKLLEKKKAV